MVKPKRSGLTLLELVVSIAIILVLIGLLVVAVTKVREAADYANGENSLRQIGIAVHTFAQQNAGTLPHNNNDWDSFTSKGWDNFKFTDLLQTANAQLLPFLGADGVYQWIFLDEKTLPDLTVSQKQSARYLFENPLDPTRGRTGSGALACSYVNNAYVFSVAGPILRCGDGASNTIFFSEHYSTCGNTVFGLFSISANRYSSNTTSSSAPTFADFGYSTTIFVAQPHADFYPITTGNPPRSTAQGGVTFQLQPRPADCDPRMPNAASSRGLQALMGDGSVRPIHGDVSSFVFWAAVTPNGGEPDMPDF
jgi:type II secretory pathway pseudopilin PulG